MSLYVISFYIYVFHGSFFVYVFCVSSVRGAVCRYKEYLCTGIRGYVTLQLTVRVACQLDVAFTLYGVPIALSLDAHRALPVTISR